MSQLDSNSAKKSTELTLIDKLSRLSYQQTLKLLGSDGPKLPRAGDKWDFRIEDDVYLGEDLFRLRFPLTPGESESAPVAVTITLMAESYDRLHWSCTACESLCDLSLLQPSPRRGRKGQGARLQEPGRAARESPTRAAPPHAP